MTIRHRTTVLLSSAMLAGAAVNGAHAAAGDPAVWIQEYFDASANKVGETRFFDWGYSGPNGRLANDFASVGGFNGATQIQRVVTLDPNRLTPDAPMDIYQDFTPSASTPDPLFTNANMDAQVNLYKWGYTTQRGSVFNNMQIDSDGDYLIARNDMAFKKYTGFSYQNEGPLGPSADGLYTDGKITFKPYALSDAIGWCGSVLASNPAAAEAMAGQVTFDFGFNATLPWGSQALQIVPDFIMRSYGSLEVDFDGISFAADAVVNNTSPTDTPLAGAGLIEVPVLKMDGSPALDANGNPRTQFVPQKQVGAGAGADPDWYNKVSFMGGGVVPAGVWVRLNSGPYVNNANIAEVYSSIDPNVSPDPGNPNVVWHANSFANYPFLLRADGIRIIEAADYSLYGDLSNVPGAIDTNGDGIPDTITNPSYDPVTNTYSTAYVTDLSPSSVPVPAAVWLFGSGLLGLVGVARKNRIGRA